MEEASPNQPLVLTADSELRDEIERLCAASGVVPEFVSHVDEGRARWSQAACVLVGDDCAPQVELADLRNRSGIAVVSTRVGIQSWQRAVGIRAQAVLELPHDRDRLAAMIADCAEIGKPAAAMVGVIGTRGGIGSSGLAAMLGLVAARLDHPAVLIDADPCSGGLDLLLGCESTPGLRWPDVAAVNGRVSAAALREALPSSRGLPVLSWAPGRESHVSAGTVSAIMAAAGRGCELVVVDLPRYLDADRREVVVQLDTVLLVAGADVRSAAAATRMASQLQGWCADLRLAIRIGRSDGLSAGDFAHAVGLPVAMMVRHTRRGRRAISEGLGPEISRRDRREFGRLIEDLRSVAVP